MDEDENINFTVRNSANSKSDLEKKESSLHLGPDPYDDTLFRQASDVRKDGQATSNLSLKDFMLQAKNNFMATEGLLFSLGYVFILTFICFPGLSDDSHFNFLSNIKNEANWYNLLCISIFNGFDLTGRYIGGMRCADVSRKCVIIMSAIRTLFVVTFMLIAFEVAPAALFGADWFKLINLALFSITNGYTSTLCAIKAPATVEGEQKGQVGAFIGVTISLGILVGSIAALGMGPVVALTPAAKAAANATDSVIDIE